MLSAGNLFKYSILICLSVVDILNAQSSVIYDRINVNNIIMYFGNNGISSQTDDMNRGLYWITDSGDTVSMAFVDGLMYGGKVDGETRVGGSNYFSGLLPGTHVNNNSEYPDSTNRIWKYRKDWERLSSPSERNRIENDAETWPVYLGAPFNDKNNDGIYSFGIDTPPETGDEINWFIMNDSDTSLTDSIFMSKPLELEIQVQILGYDESNYLGDAVYKKYKLTNKSDKVISDFYIGYWADFDIMNPFNDYVGCDSVLNMGYGYSESVSESDSNVIPPAIGYMLLQGPELPSKDYSEWNYEYIRGKKFMRSTSFSPIIKGLSNFVLDPSNKEQWYNNLKGLTTILGERVRNELTGGDTFFPYSGDPENGEGWIDGDKAPAYDRRLILNTGPISLSPGESQELVFAILIEQGMNNLNSVTLLKDKAYWVKDFYNYYIYTTDAKEGKIIPENISLSQNYPNPFNPTTQINFSLSLGAQTKLIIYDALGREVKTLINGYKPPGNYKLNFDASGLSSGVYFYRLSINDHFLTRKMILLK